MGGEDNKQKVGVLAIQGSFSEHIAALRRCGAEVVEVRQPQELRGLGGLIIPGGESTTMANVAQRNGLIPALKQFGASGRPIWGTCAGLIFLADKAHGQKEGGQALLGGLNCTVHRNFFGSQINSFETYLPLHPSMLQKGNTDTSPGSNTFRAVFIRAPAILEVGENVEVLAEYVLTASDSDTCKYKSVVVAVRQGSLLATSFHPELTSDLRWHQLFLEMVKEKNSQAEEEGSVEELISCDGGIVVKGISPGSLPIYKDGNSLVIEEKR